MIFLVLLIIAFCWSVPLHAKVVIKLGTIAPKGSPYYDILKKMGEEWREVSKGEVVLKIYPGGIIGNEIDMVRKMRQGRLQAATITSIGIREIDGSMLALQVPRMVRTDKEIDACLETLLPLAYRRLEEKGFILLHGNNSGWVRFFTTKKVRTLEELKKQKLFVAAADPKSKEVWSRTGFHAVEINSTDILPSLQTGLIDGFGATSLASLAMQWFGLAKYMLDFKLSPLVGGTLVTKKTWEKIPAELRPKLKAIAEKYAHQDIERLRKMEDESVVTMVKHGLNVVPLSEAEEKKFQELILGQYDFIRSEIVPAEAFDTVQNTITRIREAK